MKKWETPEVQSCTIESTSVEPVTSSRENVAELVSGRLPEC